MLKCVFTLKTEPCLKGSFVISSPSSPSAHFSKFLKSDKKPKAQSISELTVTVLEKFDIRIY